MCDVSRLTYNIASTGGLYSTMTGILAGFAFLAITLVLAGSHRRPDDPTPTDRKLENDIRLLLALTFAFIGLILATIQYAVLAGEGGCSLIAGRAASEELLGGIAFAFSALLLFYAIVQMLTHSGVSDIGAHVRRVVAILGPPLALLLLWLGAEDVAYTPWTLPRDGELYAAANTAFRRFVEGGTTYLVVVTLACSSGIWLLARYRKAHKKRPADLANVTRNPRASSGDASRDKPGWLGRLWALLPFAYPYVSLVFALSAVVRSTLLPETDSSVRLHGWEVMLWIGFAFAGLLLQTGLLAFENGASSANTEAGSGISETGASDKRSAPAAAATTLTDGPGGEVVLPRGTTDASAGV